MKRSEALGGVASKRGGTTGGHQPASCGGLGGEVAGTHLAHTRQRDVASGQAMGSAESRGRKQAATARN